VTLQLEVGKYYRNRQGEIAGPIGISHHPHFPFVGCWRDGCATFKADGSQLSGGVHTPEDLIEEVAAPDAKTTATTFAPIDDLPKAGMRAVEIAQKAANLVGGDRDRQHGQKPLDAHDVGVMMVCMKLARTQSGAVNPDDYVDACGYAACAGEIATNR
jgi:hypothetical protein